jgi:single-stranded DNA-binding protein
MIDALVTGRLYAKPEQRTSRNGKPFVTAKLLVSVGDERVFCNVIAFEPAPCTALLALHEGESASIAGELRPKLYEANDGTTRLTMDYTAHAVITTYHVQRKRREVAVSNAAAPGVPDDDDHA